MNYDNCFCLKVVLLRINQLSRYDIRKENAIYYIIIINITSISVGSESVPSPPWIFIHGTDIVDRGLKTLFFGLFLLFFVFFCCSPTPCKKLNSPIFFAIFGCCFFSLNPTPENFSADALDYITYCQKDDQRNLF